MSRTEEYILYRMFTQACSDRIVDIIDALKRYFAVGSLLDDYSSTMTN